MIRISERNFLANHKIGGTQPLFVMAGPCVIESMDMLAMICDHMQELCQKLGIVYVFKSSFDKANRSSVDSRRGPGLQEGLRMLQQIKDTKNVPIVTDVHSIEQVESIAQVADIIQIPAFLSRQTDLIAACAKTECWVNVKKGQFLAPADCAPIIEKIVQSGSQKYMITERGVSFGYNNLVFDPRSSHIIRSMDAPYILDCTHITQLPGGGRESGGNREFVPVIARAGVAAGVDGLFLEVHPDPPRAWSDSSNQYYLNAIDPLLTTLVRLDQFVKSEAIT